MMSHKCHVHKQPLINQCVDPLCKQQIDIGCEHCFEGSNQDPDGPHFEHQFQPIRDIEKIQQTSDLKLQSVFYDFLLKKCQDYNYKAVQMSKNCQVKIPNKQFFVLLQYVQNYCNLYAPMSKYEANYANFTDELTKELKYSEEQVYKIFLGFIEEQVQGDFRYLIKFVKNQEDKVQIQAQNEKKNGENNSKKQTYNNNNKNEDDNIMVNEDSENPENFNIGREQNIFCFKNQEEEEEFNQIRREQEERFLKYLKIICRPFNYLDQFYLKKRGKMLYQSGEVHYKEYFQQIKSLKKGFAKEILMQKKALEKTLCLKTQITRPEWYKDIVFLAFCGIDY